MDDMVELNSQCEETLAPVLDERHRVTVSELLDLRRTCANDVDCGKLLAVQYTDFAACKLNGLGTKIRRVTTRIAKLRRNTKKYSEFLKMEFKPPQSVGTRTSSYSCPKLRKLETVNMIVREETKVLKRNNSKLSKRVDILEIEQCRLNAKYEVCLEALEEAERKYSALCKDTNIVKLQNKVHHYKLLYRKAAEQRKSLGNNLRAAQEKLIKFSRGNFKSEKKSSPTKEATVLAQNQALDDVKILELDSNLNNQEEQIEARAVQEEK